MIRRRILCSTLVGVGLGLALPITGSSAQAEEFQTLPPAGSYNMPSGDRTARARAVSYTEIRTRIPGGAAALSRMKALPGKPAVNAPTVPEAAAAPAPRAVKKECQTNVATGFTPSDIHGAAGPQRLVVVTNVDIGIYKKGDCSIVSRVSLETFFGAGFTIPGAETLFDPRVLFDPQVNRFFVTVESRNANNDNQYQYIAVSKNASGNTWWLYRIVLSKGASFFCKVAVDSFWDYPNVGKNDRRWFITANDFPAGGGASGAIISINKQRTLSGKPLQVKCFNNLTFNIAPPIVLDNNVFAFFLSPGSGGGNSIVRYRLDTSAGVGKDKLKTNLSNIPVTAWTAAPDAAQPNGQVLDSLDGRFQSASIQDATRIFNVHAVNVGGFSRWRLYKLSTTGNNLFEFTPTTGAQHHLFNPSMATRSAANNAKTFVTFSRTIPGKANGRVDHMIMVGPNSSPNGWVANFIQKSAGEYSNDGNGNACNNVPQRFSCRWGDYSSTQIDPSQPSQAWGFNQLITTGDLGGSGSHFNWTTRAGKVN